MLRKLNVRYPEPLSRIGNIFIVAYQQKCCIVKYRPNPTLDVHVVQIILLLCGRLSNIQVLSQICWGDIILDHSQVFKFHKMLPIDYFLHVPSYYVHLNVVFHNGMVQTKCWQEKDRNANI